MISQKTFSIVLLVASLIVASPLIAQAKDKRDDRIPVVYRDASGNLTKESKKFAQGMVKKAKRRGYITLWLTANVPFNPDKAQLTVQEMDDQDQRVAEMFGELLQPLVDVGAVWHPTDGPKIEGPGCLVRANASGVGEACAGYTAIAHDIVGLGKFDLFCLPRNV